jgi:uncharacterized RDD family membrane protein YckC
MSQEVTIMTPEHVEVSFELAGIGSRFIAVLIDTLLQALAALILWVAVIFALGGITWMNGLSSAATWTIAVVTIVVFAILSGYFLFFEATRNGQTPGKKYAGIRVIRDTGHPIDFRAAMLRNVMRTVDSLPGMYGIGIVSVFLSSEYRRLGDYVAGTLVVKVAHPVAARPERPGSDIVQTPLSETATDTRYALPPEVMPYISSISKEDYRAVRHFLDRKRELEPGVSIDLAKRLATPIAQKIGVDESLMADPVAFLEAVSGEWERRVIH